MPIEVVVPRLGWSMDEGTFGEWLKRDGELVQRGQALFVLEGEKSAQDIESFDEGILRIPSEGPQPGDTVKVGQVLAFLVAKGEPAPFEMRPRADEPAKLQATAAAGSSSSQTPESGVGVRECGSTGVGEMQVGCADVFVPSLRHSHTQTVARDAGALSANETAVARAAGRPRATPRARRLAEKMGVDWTNVRGTGRRGRVRERDIAAVANPHAEVTSPPIESFAPGSSNDTRGTRRTLAVSSVRKTIATRMSAGTHETAPVTLTTRCDATNLVNLRDQFRAADRNVDDIIPGYNELIVKLTATALERHPLLAAQWSDREIILPEGFHIAVAVDTDAGLLAPVVRDVNRRSLRELAVEMHRLVQLARSGRLSVDQMQGGVFTITNLGMFGIDAFTPIINLPQCAILGVGRIVREPAVVENQIVARDQMTLSLTFDHRVVDGAPAARFLNDLRQAIEHPAPWLVP